MRTALLALLLVTGGLIAQAGEPEPEQCLNPEICPIPYVRLAKQETEPFLFLGKVVDKDHPRYGDYKRALRRFPDVRYCLTAKEREQPHPDLRQIDWGAIDNTREIDICVFRVASSIEDIATILLWLRYHGFEVHKMPREFSDDYVSRDDLELFFNLQSFLAIERSSRKRGLQELLVWSGAPATRLICPFRKSINWLACSQE